jgi:transposase
MVTLTMKEKQRLEVIQGIMDQKVTIEEAVRLLKRSERQVYRILATVRKEGILGIKHKRCGVPNCRRIPDKKWDRIKQLVDTKYRDINDIHLKEILEREEKIVIGRESLRKFMRVSGFKPKKQHRSKKYRSRRKRKESFGMMLQLDASDHDWLEGRSQEKLVILGAIDDATNYVWARFESAETTWGYLHLLDDVIMTMGIPLSLYSDRHTIFHSTRDQTVVEQLENKRPLTHFGRAMNELAIPLIKAWSAPAKGRIERLWGTFQDRLIVEMRLANITTRDDANRFLQTFLKDFNKRFTVQPTRKENCFRKRPTKQKLDRILCLKKIRTVNKDHTISFEGLPLQIPPSRKWTSIAKQKVEVYQLNNGSIEIHYKHQKVALFSPESVTRMMKGYKQESFQLKMVA